MRWGALEWFVLAQTFLPALVFVPGAAPLRTLTRVAVFGLAMAFWFFVARSAPLRGASRWPFPPAAWLAFGLGWWFLQMAHPDTNSLVAGAASWAFGLSVICPAFWAGQVVERPDRLRSVMAVLTVCYAVNAVVGLLQVVSPSAFLPPSLAGPEALEQLRSTGMAYQGRDGGFYVRPSGLTDTPGAASMAGAIIGYLGLCWALRPVPWYVRVLALLAAGAGVAVVLFTMVRAALLVMALGAFGFWLVLLAQRRFATAGVLAGIGGGLAAATLALVLTTNAGERVGERFSTLLEASPDKVYQNNRGMFVQEAFDRFLWEWPLGGGLGRWGMIYQYFGKKASPTQTYDIWVEVQWTAWILDGGFPLLIASTGALVLAMATTLRTALGRRCSEDVRHWAAAVFGLNLMVCALTFSYCPFVSPMGSQFWLLAATSFAVAHCRPPRRARPRGR